MTFIDRGNSTAIEDKSQRPDTGTVGLPSLSQQSWGKRQNTPWTGRIYFPILYFRNVALNGASAYYSWITLQ